MNALLHDASVLVRLRLLLLSRLNLARFTTRARRQAPYRLLAVVVLAVLLLTGVSWLLGSLLVYSLRGTNGRDLFIPAVTWGLSASTLGIFFYALLALVASFTYRSDLSLLLLSPLAPRLILAQKLLAVCAGFSLLLLVVAFPSVVGIGQALHAGSFYDLVAVATVLLVPVPPVALAMLLVVFILRWVPPARARAVATVAGVVVSSAVYVASQTVHGSTVGLPMGNAGGRWNLLPTTWAGDALNAASLHQTGGALGYLAAMTILAVLLGAVAVDRSAHLLTSGWTTYQEVARRSRRTVPRVSMPGVFPVDALTSTPSEVTTALGWAPLLRKEWLTLRRDSKLLAQLAYPLFIEGYLFYHSFGIPILHRSTLYGHVARLFAGYLYLSSTLTALFLLTVLALPIVGREGNALYIMALLPVPVRRIFLAKWLFCVGPVVALMELLVLLVAVPTLRLGPWVTVFDMALMAALVTAMGGGLFCIGLIWPRLGSDNSRRQVHLAALVMGPLFGVFLSTVIGGFVVGVFSDHPRHAWDAVVSVVAIFVLLGGLCGAVVALGPRLLQRLFTGDRRPV